MFLCIHVCKDLKTNKIVHHTKQYILYEMLHVLFLECNMALTNAEKQRRFREKRDNDPQRRAEYLQKKNEKYKQDIEVGERYLIDQM